jgi:hypothetical protein
MPIDVPLLISVKAGQKELRTAVYTCTLDPIMTSQLSATRSRHHHTPGPTGADWPPLEEALLPAVVSVALAAAVDAAGRLSPTCRMPLPPAS